MSSAETVPFDEDWEKMAPIGREWGAPNADTLWALDALVQRLTGTGLSLHEGDDGVWKLRWCRRVIARWTVENFDPATIDLAVAAAGDDPMTAWRSANR